ncbi:MAG: hypothetical protein COV75_03560 [Candidatus Omnitrophica bacterium CG11_big_fil_rev_8_21_14_0_20_63_9]|nr:MAG: hypothetical protein COV75_03560 [Candidatus Omnitrophica bacterium CG11_big_fil_rev_8_21_14_0_20_63_9]
MNWLDSHWRRKTFRNHYSQDFWRPINSTVRLVKKETLRHFGPSSMTINSQNAKRFLRNAV